ncbi:MAG: SBBP repeat-containing protein, partial [Bacteroidia bacterium]
LTGDVLSFVFPNDYDHSEALIIDPTVVFSTYTGSTQDNWGFTATYDNNGNAFGGGIIFNQGFMSVGSTGFPILGAFQGSFQGGERDATITKYSPSGNSLIFSTYLGGEQKDQPHSLVADVNGNLFVLGRTSSNDFPMQGPSYDNSHNGGSDIFLAKFSPTGALLTSTFVGGTGDDAVNYSDNDNLVGDLKYNYGDDARGEIIVDNAGNCYVASCTKSSNFPTTGSAFQPNFQGGQDGVVFKMNSSLSALLWSGYLGGSGNDAAYSLEIDDNQNVFVAGGTKSGNFPVTGNVVQNSFAGGGIDGFLTKISPNGATLLKSTYIGTSSYDQCYFVKIDKQNRIYLFGQTEGSMSFIGGVYGQQNAKQFISRLDNDLVAYDLRTTIGTAGSAYPNISPTAFLVDICGNIYISGWGGEIVTGQSSAGTFNMPLSPDAYDNTTDGTDFYLAVLDKNAQGLLYATYFGGNNLGEHVDGGTSRFDKNGVVYGAVCAGCGSSNGFPTTPGAWSQQNNSNNCNLAVFKIDMGFSGIEGGFLPTDIAGNVVNNSQGCAPFEVHFLNTTTGTDPNTTIYSWYFGTTGATSNQAQPVYTFTTPGVYSVSMYINDPTNCNPLDTVIKTITVHAPPLVDAGPTQVICLGGVGATLQASGAINYTWTPATALSSTVIPNPVATPTSNTLYTVTGTDSHGCSASDTVSVVLSNQITVAAREDTLICQGTTAPLSAQASVPAAYSWYPPVNLSNPNIQNPTVTPPNTTVYYIEATDALGCKAVDSVQIAVFTTQTINDTVICDGAEVTLYSLGGVTFSWFPATYLSNASIQNPIAHPPSPIAYTLTAVNEIGCVSSDVVNIGVQTLPTANAGANQTMCVGQSVSLSGSGGLTYSWFPTTGLSSGNNPNPTASPSNSTSYLLTVFDDLGCHDHDTVSVTVNPLPTIFINAPNKICIGDTANLQASGALTYSWTPNPSLTATNIPNPKAFPDKSVTYFVTGLDINGCSNTANTTVEVIPTPKTVLDGENQTCIGGSIVLSAYGGINYIWSTGDSTATIYVQPTEPKWYYCTAYVDGCIGTPDSIFVDVLFDKPIANFTADTTFGFNPTIVHFTNLSTNSDAYIWNFGTGAPISQAENPTHVFANVGEFQVSLIAINDNGCKDTAYLQVVTEGVTLYVPTAFSPNGDGFNEEFLAKHYGIKDLHVSIYDRWGIRIYEAFDLEFRWDGKYKGQDVPEGVYVWVIDGYGYDNRKYEKKGTVTVIR